MEELVAPRGNTGKSMTSYWVLRFRCRVLDLFKDLGMKLMRNIKGENQYYLVFQ